MTSRAITLRDHGHRPSLATLSSSIAITATLPVGPKPGPALILRSPALSSANDMKSGWRELMAKIAATTATPRMKVRAPVPERIRFAFTPGYRERRRSSRCYGFSLPVIDGGIIGPVLGGGATTAAPGSVAVNAPAPPDGIPVIPSGPGCNGVESQATVVS